MTIYHVLSPHRDDAWLIFGGFLCSEISRGSAVIIHILFGVDGYVLADLSSEIEVQRGDHPYLQELLHSCFNAGLDCNEVAQRLKGGMPSPDNLRIMIRSLEENIIAAGRGARIIEYPLRTAFPLRGYTDFDSPIDEKDAESQLALLCGDVPQQEQKFWCILRQSSEPSVMKAIQHSMAQNVNEKIVVLAPAAIGGHPDHVVTARFALKLQKQFADNLTVVFGQDLPYAFAPEGFVRTGLDFSLWSPAAFAIEHCLSDKLEALRSYRSQMSQSMIESVAHYARLNALLLNSRQRPIRRLNFTDSAASVEIQYRL